MRLLLIIIIALLSLSLTAAGLVFVNSGPQTELLQTNFVDSLNRATGRAVLYDSVSQRFIGYRPAVVINNLKVPDLLQMNNQYAITARQVRFYLNPFKWAAGSFDVQRIEVLNPKVFITLNTPDQIALPAFANWAALFSRFPQIIIRDAQIVSQSRFKVFGGALHVSVAAGKKFGKYDIKGIAAYKDQRFDFTGFYAMESDDFQLNALSSAARLDISGKMSVADGLSMNIAASDDDGLKMSGKAVVSHNGFTLSDLSYVQKGFASVYAGSLTADRGGLSGDLRIDGYRQQTLRVPTDINLNNLKFSGENVQIMNLVFDLISFTVNQNEDVTTAQDLTFRAGDVSVSNGTYMFMDDILTLNITDGVHGTDNRFTADVKRQDGMCDVTINAGTFDPAMLNGLARGGLAYTAKIIAKNMIWGGDVFGPAKAEYSHDEGINAIHWITSDDAKITNDANGHISFDIKAPLKLTDDIAARFGLDMLKGKAVKIDGTMNNAEINAIMQIDDKNKLLAIGSVGAETFNGQISFIFAEIPETTCTAAMTKDKTSFSNCMSLPKESIKPFEIANKDLSVKNIVKKIKP